jgi:hypothetical protein
VLVSPARSFSGPSPEGLTTISVSDSIFAQPGVPGPHIYIGAVTSPCTVSPGFAMLIDTIYLAYLTLQLQLSHLNAAKFKPLRFVLTASEFILVILYDFCLLSAHCCYNNSIHTDRLCGSVFRVPGSITVLPGFLRSSGSGTGPAQPREYN